MSIAAPLVAAKHLPPRPSHFHLPRPRLHQRLRDGLSTRATVILAGPGYGKTSLAARFLQDAGEDSVWYRLDPFDRDPWMFFQYLIQGIREQIPEFGERSEGLWRDLRSGAPEPERLADVFISEAEELLGGRLIVVLDEVHTLLEGEGCARALRRLLRYLPGALHLFLIGRSLPELGIQSLVAQQQVNVIPGQELRFNEEETRELLAETFGMPVDADTVRGVHARTRGWVTALQLLRQTARLGGSAADLPDEMFAETEADVFEYFSEEVLAAEEGEVRDFLLGAAVPQVLDAELCGEVLGRSDVARQLTDLVRQNLFLSQLEGRRGYYAFDPLFRDFLLRKLREVRGEDGYRELHGRYAGALDRRGDAARALHHYLEARAAPALADLLRREGRDLLRRGLLEPVQEAARSLAGRPDAAAIAEDLLGEAARVAGDHAAAAAHFERALAAAAPPPAGRPDPARAQTLQGLAYSLMKYGDAGRARETAEAALALAGDEAPGLTARILNTLSILHFREHRHRDAVRGWQEALARARQAEDDHLVRMIAHNLGLPHAVKGDFRQALEAFRILLRADSQRIGPEEGTAYLNTGRIATLRGEHEIAAGHLENAREIARKWNLSGLLADVLEAEGILLRETGNLDGARERFERARTLLTELGQVELLDGLAEEEAILAALEGDPGAAERLGEVLERRRQSGDPEGIASTLAALGEVRARRRDPAAIEPLEEAAALFESVGRRFQRCGALVWLALTRHVAGRAEAAREAAEEAAKIAARHDYRAALERAAGADQGFRELLGTVPAAAELLSSSQAPVAPLQADRPDLTVRLLGPVEVFRDPDQPIPPRAWKVRRALQVFCLLASSRDYRSTKDRIVDAVWGDAAPEMIEKNFHPTVSFLRAALNRGHKVSKNFVLFERGAYRLNPEYRYDIDVDRFEERVRAGRAHRAGGEDDAARDAYREALALYRGPFLDEEYEAWVEGPRARLEGLYRAALGEAAEVLLGCGDTAEAVEVLERLVASDPINEEPSRKLMRALGRAGNRGGVDREFARIRRQLDEELGAEPDAETRRTHQEALAGGSRP